MYHTSQASNSNYHLVIERAYLGANDKHRSLLANMLARSNDIEFLIRTPITRLRLHGDQILPEISSGGIDVETASVGGLERDGREGASGGVVALLGFGCGIGFQETACAGDFGAVGCGVEAGEDAGCSGNDGGDGGGEGESGEDEIEGGGDVHCSVCSVEKDLKESGSGRQKRNDWLGWSGRYR